MKKFWKFLKIFLLGLLAFFIITVIGGYFFLKHADIQKYKPQIINIASQSLGRAVDFKDIHLVVSLEKGIRLRLTDLTIAEDPAFGTAPFLSSQEIDAGVDLLAFLKTREISVPNILLRAPRVNLIRNAAGAFNAQSLGAENAPEPALTPSPAKQAAATVPGIFIDALKIENAEIRLIDLSTQPETRLAVTQLDFAVNRFSLTHPFDVLLEAAVLSPKRNLRVTFNVQLNLLNKEAILSGMEMTADLGTLLLDELRRFPLLSGVPIPQVLGGQFKTAVKELTVSDKGVGQAIIDVSLTDGKCVLPNAAPGVSLDADNIQFKIENFRLDGNTPFHVDFQAALFHTAPNVTFNGDASLDISNQAASIENGTALIDLNLLSLEKLKTSGLIPAGAPLPKTLGGKIHLTLKKAMASAKGLENLLADLRLEDGNIFMPEAAAGISLTVQKINFDVKNFSLKDPFSIQGSLAYENETPNLTFQSAAQVDLSRQSLRITDGTVSTDLSQWSWGRLKSAIAALKDAPLPETSRGNVDVSIKELTAGPTGLNALLMDIALNGGHVKMKDLAVPLEGLTTLLRLTSSDITMDKLSASLGKGQISARFGMKNYLSAPTFEAQAEIQEINLAEILHQKESAVKVEGMVSGRMQAQGQVMDLNSITAQGAFDVKDAKLKDLNVLKTVLDSISFLPDVGARLESQLPERYKEKLQNKDTEIKKVSLTCSIANGDILIDPTAIEADEFIFSGKTQAGFDQKYAMDGPFKIPAELSAAMTQDIEEMQYLYDEAGRISLPIHVKGQGSQIPQIDILQTAADIIKNAMRNKGKEELKKVLFEKILGGESSSEENPEAAAQNPGQQPSEPENQTSPGEQIIDDILDRIFK
jgi:hypothetical protein